MYIAVYSCFYLASMCNLINKKQQRDLRYPKYKPNVSGSYPEWNISKHVPLLSAD